MHHKSYSPLEIQEIIHSKGVIEDESAVIRTLAFDSRKLVDVEHSLFFALSGRRDGHEFIQEVYQEGVRSFVVRDAAFASNYPEANFYVVENTLAALQALTAYHRHLFNYPVIGITGSNGKTVVKEWLYQLLGPNENIIRSPKSFNSQLGVPLSVWEMNEDHTLAIFEAGVSHTGEMAALEKIIRPTIGILTTIGEAHNEGFSSREEKIAEKLTLFNDADLFIYCSKYLQGFKAKIPGKKKFTWGWQEDADLKLTKNELVEGKATLIQAEFQGRKIQCTIPFIDAASVENAICCWASVLALGYQPEDAGQRLENLHPVRMRLELKNGINNCSIIDDSYSSDISSLAIALDFLRQQNQNDRRTLILSDILEAGLEAELLYKQVAQLLEAKDVDRLIGVGTEITRHRDKFSLDKVFFESTEELLDRLPALSLADETILLKGARSFGFERISKLLTQKVHETVLEINMNALEHNLNYYKSLLNPGTRLMAMVKAFSYGSGSFEVANLLQFNKVDYLAVAYADEGVTLRRSGISLPIMVMNPDVMAFDTMVEHQLEPEIYSFRVLRDFTEALNKKTREHYPVHIKLDTGMHRLGFVAEELDALISELSTNKSIRVTSVFSHLVASEDAGADDFTRQQIREFKTLTERLEQALGYSFIKHVSNTAGISRWPEAQFDMVRLGIGLYGFDGSYKNKKSPLQTVTTLKTSISQIKELKPGETVGYNRRGVLPEGGKIATVKIGYADGYSRKLGNGLGKMLVNGTIVPTIGTICMDMCMIDITGVDATEGDEVIVFNEEIRVEDIADQLGTIPYEVFTGISERVKRVYYYE
ncbi:bifunctional UDP-N-acetylmuramoyl-tripeptide:D-alanyl-D-alanine ligase/alanine racemase [Pedobacter sp. SYSU D00535]|uniref:bifunctional UDP-N-acetylmuramoyl-tripeptide:D-alanyl-D-alanine ligase/alanine racemase n=1 Tax=Pedobacter sp. SYSU D00535 TaxID=2810308 RepID=UPI001A965D92|nr:bifunctional UDP-N-acetylmuramoyl-tripeptide:D-alanyl-D-alanine ligase/alanine racemase [Pedobacter sp. SYSU D00535]